MANNLLSYTDDNTYIFSDFYSGRISSRKKNYIGLIDFLSKPINLTGSTVFNNCNAGGDLGPWTIENIGSDYNFYLTTNIASGTRRFFMITLADDSVEGFTTFMRHHGIFKHYCRAHQNRLNQ